ncbi:hypothetical protein [Actinokineospora pegani]|uniref:hypothetical protein n=1 Tax=Actinokineospora pegani TaxID=2654637 RepID=UPI0012EA24A0|nr:hypothetical protein [Actinokineospora pegani]
MNADTDARNIAIAVLCDVLTALTTLMKDPENHLTPPQSTKFHDLINAAQTAAKALDNNNFSDDAFNDLDVIVHAIRRTAN